MDAAAATQAGLDRIVSAIDAQIGWCRVLGSPFTANILELIRDNLTGRGALAPLVVPWPGDPLTDVLSLRLAGVLHMLARTGRAPGLAPYYPAYRGPGGNAAWDAPAVARAIETAVAANADFVRDFIARPPQTNEIGRSAILMPGYAVIARRTGLPLRILELGASAGLNLMWDRYAYRLGDHRVGDANSPVTVSAEWRGAWPGIEHLPRVVERRGCDRTPIDLDEPGATDRLLSYVWPDQSERMARLEGAIALARRDKPPVEKADAGEWLERCLAAPVEGVATVVAHTIVWQYFSKETAERAGRAIRDAGVRASVAAPLAWLSFEEEAPNKPPKLKLTLWPGGETQTLARAHPHGTLVEWQGALGV